MNSAIQFETIVDEYYEPLFRFAMSLTRAESDAKDLTQQTFYVWATKGHQLRDPLKVKTWLFTTLHRAFLKTRKRQVRFPELDLEVVPEPAMDLSVEFVDRVDGAQILAALARVDEVFRPAVALFYLSDYPYKDIAAILEVPIGTVKSRVARGIRQLREILLPAGSNGFALDREKIPCVAHPEEPAMSPDTTLPRDHDPIQLRLEPPKALPTNGTKVLLASGNDEGPDES